MHDRTDDLIRRALAAYLRTGGDPDDVNRARSTVEEIKELSYVVLRSKSSVIAVYRVRTYDGVLRRMKRWPKTIT